MMATYLSAAAPLPPPLADFSAEGSREGAGSAYGHPWDDFLI